LKLKNKGGTIMPVKAKYIKDLPLKRVLDGSESLLVQDLNGTQQAPLGTIVDEIKQNSQEKIGEIESELNQTNTQLSETNYKIDENYQKVNAQLSETNYKIDENYQKVNTQLSETKQELSSQLDNKANKAFILSNEFNSLQEGINSNIHNINEFVFLEEKYELDETINILKNVKLKGNGIISNKDTSIASILNCEDKDYIEIDGLSITSKNIRTNDTANGIINIKNVKKVVLRNLEINGEILLNTTFGLGGINLENVENAIIENCIIKNVKNGIRLNKVKNYIIRDNLIETNKIPSLWSETNTNMFYGLIIDNLIDNTLNDINVCNLENNSGDIYNNYFFGWDISISSRFSNNSNIYNNKIFNTCFPITIDRSDKINLFNNIVDLTESNIESLHLFIEVVATSNSNIYNNTLISKSRIGTGVGVYGDSTISWYNQPVNNNIYSNNIQSCNNGVTISQNAKYTKAYDNKIVGCNNGVYLSVNNINGSEINRNIINDSYYYGIVVDEKYLGVSDYIRVENNTILNSKNVGIYGNDANLGESIVEFKNNYLFNNSKELYGMLKNSIFKNNTFKALSKTDNCIVLQDTTGTITMIENNIFGVITLKSGLTIKSYKNVFEGNIWNVSPPTVVPLIECNWI
jgi:uncharacterized membrane-anchored protein YhcB (DUF1043 family)